MPQENIVVVGAREHNLKDVSISIPRDKLVVISGLSGSGKSSLAFDTIFAEGQRRYVESLSAYARQFLGQLDKPDVDYIEGLVAFHLDRPARRLPQSPVNRWDRDRGLRLPAAALRPRRNSSLPYLRARGQAAVRPGDCGRRHGLRGRAINSWSWPRLVRGRKGTHTGVFDEIRRSGFVRVRVDGEVRSVEDEFELDRYKNHTIEVAVDRLVVPDPGSSDEEETQAFQSRLTNSVETALRWGNGTLIVADLSQDSGTDIPFSEDLACSEHGTTLSEIEPRTFSFNTPHGACPDCQGLGTRLEIDPDRIIPDKQMSLAEGAVVALEWSSKSADRRSYYWQLVEAVAEAYDINLEAPVAELPTPKLEMVLYGTDGQEVPFSTWAATDASPATRPPSRASWATLNDVFRKPSPITSAARSRSSCRSELCPTCHGQRLRPEALSVTIDDTNIVEVTHWPVVRSRAWVESLQSASGPLDKRGRKDRRTRSQGDPRPLDLPGGRRAGLPDP